jgi:sodium-coupled neutral amino acid transporter 11
MAKPDEFNIDCLDMVNETIGMGAMEVDNTPTSQGHIAPRRQISNLSLPNRKSGLGGAQSNLINSIVGAGIIGVPFALKESGLVAGVILLFLVSYFTGE